LGVALKLSLRQPVRRVLSVPLSFFIDALDCASVGAQ
jgi:hypothetical protein